MTKRADRVISLLANAGATIGGVGILLMMLHVCSDVLLRTVIGISMPATLVAVSHYYMLAASFAPLALAERERAHISVELIDRFLTPRQRKVLDLGVALVTAALMMALAVRTLAEAVGAYHVGTVQMDGSHRIVTWPAYFILPFGTSVIGLLAFARAVRIIQHWRSK